MPRRAPKVDGNHKLIVAALKAAGWYVKDTSGAGKGFVDLVVAKGGRLELIEVKDPAQPPNKRALTEDETAVHLGFAQAGVEVRILMTVEEAVRL